MRQSCTECKPRDEMPLEGRWIIKREVFQGRRMWRPGSSCCFPQRSQQFPFPPWRTIADSSGITLLVFKATARSSQVQLNSWGLKPVANMFQSHRQEHPESIVSRNQISLIPEDPHPDPTVTACWGMVSPSPLLASLPGQI